MGFRWPWTTSYDNRLRRSYNDLLKHIKDCHEIMGEAASYIENPLLATKNRKTIVTDLKFIIERGPQ